MENTHMDGLGGKYWKGGKERGEGGTCCPRDKMRFSEHTPVEICTFEEKHPLTRILCGFVHTFIQDFLETLLWNRKEFDK